GDALKFACSEVLKLEEIAEKFPGALGDDHHARFGDALQPCGQVWRLADDATLRRIPGVHQVANNNEASRNPDTGLQSHARPQGDHRCNQFEPRADRTLGIVLMGLRIAKIDQHTVAEILRDKAIVAAYDPGDALMISGNDLA